MEAKKGESKKMASTTPSSPIPESNPNMSSAVRGEDSETAVSQDTNRNVSENPNILENIHPVLKAKTDLN